ncbi:MAG: N-acetylmuramoyl-L-alanine amidase, partial [Planctomycetota bacterium]
DVSRYLGHRVGEALRTQIGVTGILMTDLQMYEGGFGVLRHSNVPAALGEFSFFSNPDEEQRLRDAIYNLRCAYAIYVAFCEYNYGGRPTQTLPTLSPGEDAVLLTSTLDEGLPEWWGSDRTRIFRDSVAVTLNGEDLPITFDPETNGLSAELPASVLESADRHIVKIRHNNFYKHGNWPQRYAISQEGEQWVVSPLGAQRIDNDAEPGGSLSPAKPRD